MFASLFCLRGWPLTEPVFGFPAAIAPMQAHEGLIQPPAGEVIGGTAEGGIGVEISRRVLHGENIRDWNVAVDAIMPW